MIVSYNNLKSIKELLMGEPWLYVDTETYGLLHEDKPFSLAMCGSDKAYYFNFKHYEGLHSNFVLDPQDLHDILKACDRVFAHNAKFDIQMLRKLGIEPNQNALVHCTAANERVAYNAYGHWSEYSLDNCGKRIGIPKDNTVEEYIKKHKLYTDGKPRYDLVPIDLISKYALNDVILCREISKHQVDYNDSRDSIRLSECIFTEVVAEMQWNGVKIDQSYLQQGKAWHQQQAQTLRDEYHRMTQNPFIDSNKELERAFAVLGEKFPLTDKGNPSFRASALDKMTTPLAQIVKKIRYHEKMFSTYFLNIEKQIDSFGFIHPDIIQHGTETGRISCRDPNMNNLPHHEDYDLFPVRKLFVPRNPDNCFVFIDYKQQEYRLLLDLAGEQDMIKKIMEEGLDIHKATAELVGITRDAAKTLNFALLYGMGIPALAEALKCTEAEAILMRNEYFKKLPKVQQFIKRVKRDAIEKGYAVNAYGRFCHAVKPEDSYKIPNHVIQGGCADIMKTAMNRIHLYLQDQKMCWYVDTFMVGQVYDELILEMPEEMIHKVVPTIAHTMRHAYKPLNGLMMDVDVEISALNWEETIKYTGSY